MFTTASHLSGGPPAFFRHFIAAWHSFSGDFALSAMDSLPKSRAIIGDVTRSASDVKVIMHVTLIIWQAHL